MKDKTCWHHDICIIKTPCDGCLEHSKITPIERCMEIAQQIIDHHYKIFKHKIAGSIYYPYIPNIYHNYNQVPTPSRWRFPERSKANANVPKLEEHDEGERVRVLNPSKYNFELMSSKNEG
jgi:hypothetical protein